MYQCSMYHTAIQLPSCYKLRLLAIIFFVNVLEFDGSCITMRRTSMIFAEVIHGDEYREAYLVPL
jgi:hypothetical protein